MITEQDFEVAKIVKANTEIKNPFLKWGIKSVAPSSFNLWAESPESWICKYLMKLPQDPSCRMNAGSVSEKVTYKLLMGVINFDNLTKDIENEFASKNGMLGTEDERKAVLKDMIGYEGRTKNYKGYVVNGYEGLKILGKPIKYQSKINYDLKYFGIKANGYKDFSYEGFDVDMKTTSKMASVLPIAYRRQLAFYKMENPTIEQRLLLCTKDKSQMYILEDSYSESKDEINHILNTMAIALSECNSVEELLTRYYPNWEFYKLNYKQKDELRKYLKNIHKISWQQRLEDNEFERGIS